MYRIILSNIVIQNVAVETYPQLYPQMKKFLYYMLYYTSCGRFSLYIYTHLHRYYDEFAFQWTYRDVDDGDRGMIAMHNA